MRPIDQIGLHTDAPFRWLHFNLADRRTKTWLERCADLPAGIRPFLTTRDLSASAIIEAGSVGLLLKDFERDLDSVGSGRVGPLRIMVMPGLIVTGRHHPLRSPDLIRVRIVKGDGLSGPAEGLEIALSGLLDSMTSVAHDVTVNLARTEDRFLNEHQTPDTRDLIDLRRRAAQVHRMIGETRSILHGLEIDPGLPTGFAAVLSRIAHRLSVLDAGVMADQNQLRLLRDELDLVAAQRSNQNIYFLSIMTALMAPATLVTGFFGMNTGGLPFAGESHGGTVVAGLAAIAASAGTYIALRMLGFVRRQ